MINYLFFAAIVYSQLVFASNPFEEFMGIDQNSKQEFYAQVPPFVYPFKISNQIKNKGLNLQAMEEKFSSDVLNQHKEMFSSFDFLPQYFLYNYTFPIHPQWEILPYPYVSKVPHPKKWISHFSVNLSQGEGILSEKFHQDLDQLTHTKAYAGNKLQHFKSPDSYREILNLLSTAKDHVFLSSYLFHCDKGSEELIKEIKLKTTQGVKVYIIYDKFYSRADPSCAFKLRENGAQVALHRGRRINHIFHEKMFVFDGEYALIDGQNIIATQALSTGTNNLLNDVSVGVKGPMVAVIGNRFIHHWVNVLGLKLDQKLIKFYQTKQKESERFSHLESIQQSLKLKRGQGLCRLVTKDPGKHNSQIMDLYLHTVKNTKNYLFFNYIDPQYKNTEGKKPGELFLGEVIELVNKNPDLRVDMLTNNWKRPTDVYLPPGVSIDKNLFSRITLKLVDIVMKRPYKLMQIMRHSIASWLNSPNFHWWSYTAYMHAKTLMSDNVWTIIGTHNINTTAENLSYEIVLACLDTELAENMQHSIVIDSLNAIPVPISSR